MDRDNMKLALATGIDFPILDDKVIIHQPKIEEIATMGEQNYFTGLKCMCLDVEKDKMGLQEVNNFQVFKTIMDDKENRDKKRLIMQVLNLLFPNYQVQVSPRALLLNLETETTIIDENNFSSLQEVLRLIGCLGGAGSGDSFNPSDDVAAEIARKLERGRQRVAAQKQDAEANASVFSQYLSIIHVGLDIPLTELSKYTVYQLYDAIERYTLKVNWDIDIKTRLAGGKPDSQPDN